MMMRKPRHTGAWIMALGALAGCGSEEAFSLQLGATERLIDTEAVAQLANEDHMVWNLSVVGDIDGDGIDDAVIVTYSAASPNGKGPLERNEVYVVYGGSQLHGAIDLATLPSLTMEGPSGDAVAVLGDVDGDGLADFLVSAASPVDSPRPGAYLVYGNRTRLTGATPMSSVGALLVDTGHNVSVSMAALGDLDGDGKADFALGLAGSNDPGALSGEPDAVLVFYGRSARLSGTVDLRATADATIVEPVSSVLAPYLTGAGDVDGDGHSDLILSTNLSTDAFHWQQEIRLVTGSATRLAGKVALGDVAHTRLPDITCPLANWEVGRGLGDLDGDGADDFSLIGCATPPAGKVSFTYVHHVFYGRPGGMPAQLANADAAATVHPSFSDFQSANFSQLIGADIDGDGIGDLILADESLRDSQGGVHLMRGGAHRFAGDIDPLSQSFLTYVGAQYHMPGCTGRSCGTPELVGHGVAVGDLTGDHHPEVITGARGLFNDSPGHGLSPSRTYIVSPSISRGP